MGRLIGTTTSYSFLGSGSFANAYAYDAASNRTRFTDQENGATTHTCDAIFRVTLAVQGMNSTASFSHRPVGNRPAAIGQ
jgi:hypothetical protein